jgi:hypothetical protein
MTNGSTVMESVPLRDGDALPTLRKQAADYANRFNIPFLDSTGPD